MFLRDTGNAHIDRGAKVLHIVGAGVFQERNHKARAPTRIRRVYAHKAIAPLREELAIDERAIPRSFAAIVSLLLNCLCWSYGKPRRLKIEPRSEGVIV